MNTFIQHFMLGVVLARPTEHTTIQEGEKTDQDSDQNEEDSSPSSSEDDYKQKSLDKRETKPYSHTDTNYSNTDTPYSHTATPYGHTDAPYSNTDTPYSHTDTPYSHTDTPYSHTATPYSHTATPYSHTDTPYSHTDTPKSDNNHSYSRQSYEQRHRENRCKEYGIPGPPKVPQDLASPASLSPNVTLLGEALSNTTLDRAPSEANDLQRKEMFSMFRGETQATAHPDNMSWEPLSADDLTFDARVCVPPRRKLKDAYTKKGKLAQSEYTVSKVMNDENQHYPHTNQLEKNALNDFIKDLVRKEISPQANVKFYDAAIVYEKEDYEGAMHFKEETMMIVKSELNEEVRIELFDSQEFAQSKVCVVEDVLSKCSLVFVYLTPYFKSPELLFFIEEAIGMSRLGLGNEEIYAGIAKNDRQWILKPIHTMPPKFRAYKVPVGLLSLNGIEWYNKDSAFTRNQIRAVMHKAINTRKQREMHTGIHQQCSRMFGADPREQVQAMYEPRKPITHNLKPDKHVPFISHQSQDAMSLTNADQLHYTQFDPFTSGRNVSPLTSVQDRHQQFTVPSQRHTTNSHVHTNREGQLNEPLNSGISSYRLARPNHQEQHPPLPRTMYASNGHSSQQHMSSAAFVQHCAQSRNLERSTGLQNQSMQPDRSNSFQGITNQNPAPYVYQSAGLQNYMKPGTYEGYQTFSDQPRPQMYRDSVPIQRNNAYTNQTNTVMQSVQGGLPVHWSPQNNLQPPAGSRFQCYPRQQHPPNMSNLYTGQQLDMQGIALKSPTSNQNVNVQQAGFYGNYQDQHISRDALQSEPGSYHSDYRNAASDSSQISVVSKVTGKLIINPNLSTDDVEIDNDASIQTGINRVNSTSSKRKGKRVKKGRIRSTYELEESNSDSDFDIQTKSKGAKKIVNIVGCKVVQMGSGNRVKERNSRCNEDTEQQLTVNSKRNVRSEKERVEDVGSSFMNLPSPHTSHTEQNRRFISPTRSNELSADKFSFQNSFRTHDNISAGEKHFPEKKNIPESLVRYSDAQKYSPNISAGINRLGSVAVTQTQDQKRLISRNDVNNDSYSFEERLSNENSRSSSKTDDSGAYNTGRSTFNKENVAPFMFSLQSKSRAIDVFAGRKLHQTENDQNMNQVNEECEID